jgi:hypothetical protein
MLMAFIDPCFPAALLMLIGSGLWSLFLGSMLSGVAVEEIGAPLTALVYALIGIAGTLGIPLGSLK